MAFPITYEARRNGKLEMLVVAKEKGQFSWYFRNGEIETEKDYSPKSKNIFDDPRTGVGYMGIGNIMSEDVDEPKITEGASEELVDSLVKEMRKNSK
jgi:hypothetical protein